MYKIEPIDDGVKRYTLYMMGNICKTIETPVGVDPVIVCRERPETVIHDLEQRGYVEAVKASPNVLITNDVEKMKDVSNHLIGFMTAGANEFEERTGRKMTYAEMRAAWG
jgi:hypothetical protein